MLDRLRRSWGNDKDDTNEVLYPSLIVYILWIICLDICRYNIYRGNIGEACQYQTCSLECILVQVCAFLLIIITDIHVYIYNI